MKDTVKEIEELALSLGTLPDYYSEILIDLFDEIAQSIKYNSFEARLVLYKVENLLDIFNPALKADIKLLEELKEKLERLNKIVL